MSSSFHILKNFVIRHIWILSVIFVVLLPYILFEPRISRKILILSLHGTFLFFLYRIHRILFGIFITFLAISGIVVIHLALHWGDCTEDIKQRIGVIVESPIYEMKEYLHDYISLIDLWELFYIIFVGIFLFFALKKYPKTFIKRQYILWIFILFFILQNQTPYVFIKYYIREKARQSLIHNRLQFISHAKLPDFSTFSPLYDDIIVIVGESMNRNHMSLYGYPIPTTPNLKNIYLEGNMSIFKAIAPANQTRISVPILLSPVNVSNFATTFKYTPSIISYFKHAGFTTFWLSNQGRVGKHASYITSMALEADSQIFFTQGTYRLAKFDGVFPEYFRKHGIPRKKAFYVIHLIGSHTRYSLRYPPQKALFKHPSSIVEEYDNSIHYTDQVVSDIIRFFQRSNKKVLIIITSDHSETITKTVFGHGFTPPKQNEYHIPLIIYSTTNNPRLHHLKNIISNKLINTENLDQVILYLSGLTSHLKISFSHSVISKNAKNIINYDTLDIE